MRVAVVGASGLIGGRVARALLARGDEVLAVSRRPSAGVAGAEDVRWDPAEGPLPAEIRSADAVINMAGSPMDRWRWTASRKRQIRESRVTATRRLAEAAGGDGFRVLVNASGVGYYGPRGDEVLDEDASPGDDFLAQTCVAWEREAARAAARGARVVMVRTGIVLDGSAGALPRLAMPVRLFAGGPIGGGRQWVPWIHVDDEAGIVLHALDRDDLEGPVNAAAPEPARQRDVVRVLGRVLGRPTGLPTPALAVRLALGEMSTLALDGQRAVPRAALASGYQFAHPDLEEALRSALGR